MAEKVVKKDGYYEVEPWRMTEYLHQHTVNDEAIKKMHQDRILYLTWMHEQEAGRCLPG